jgi:hypothetical protein
MLQEYEKYRPLQGPRKPKRLENCPTLQREQRRRRRKTIEAVVQRPDSRVEYQCDALSLFN